MLVPHLPNRYASFFYIVSLLLQRQIRLKCERSPGEVVDLGQAELELVRAFLVGVEQVAVAQLPSSRLFAIARAGSG